MFVAQATDRSSRQRVSRLRWLAPAPARQSSKCSCRSPEGPGADKGARRVQGMPGAPPSCLPASRMSLRAAVASPPPQAVSLAASASPKAVQGPAGAAMALRGTSSAVQCSSSSVVPEATPPTRPFMALLTACAATCCRAFLPSFSSLSLPVAFPRPARGPRLQGPACCPATWATSSSKRPFSQ